jgi:hypothetical protein
MKKISIAIMAFMFIAGTTSIAAGHTKTGRQQTEKQTCKSNCSKEKKDCKSCSKTCKPLSCNK